MISNLLKWVKAHQEVLSIVIGIIGIIVTCLASYPYVETRFLTTPTSTPTSTYTPTPTSTHTPTPTDTSTPTPTITPTSTPTVYWAATATPIPTPAQPTQIIPTETPLPITARLRSIAATLLGIIKGHPYFTLVVLSIGFILYRMIRQGRDNSNNDGDSNSIIYGEAYSLPLNYWQLMYRQLMYLEKHCHINWNEFLGTYGNENTYLAINEIQVRYLSDKLRGDDWILFNSIGNENSPWHLNSKQILYLKQHYHINWSDFLIKKGDTNTFLQINEAQLNYLSQKLGADQWKILF